jgi:GNAT superfamily N-acetyltransferase
LAAVESEVRSAAPVPGLLLELARYDDPVVAALVEALQQEFVVRYGARDETPVHPDDFAPPRGVFVLAWAEGAPVGCGGWRRVDGELAELGEVKRMYVVPSHRRRGLSRVVLAALESSAREAGLRRLRLETGDQQPEALSLYATSGWEPVPAFGRYACEPGAAHFGKQL